MTRKIGVEDVSFDRVGVVLINAVNEQQVQIETQQIELKQQRTITEHQQDHMEKLQIQIKQQQALIDGLKKLVCGSNPKAEVCGVEK